MSKKMTAQVAARFIRQARKLSDLEWGLGQLENVLDVLKDVADVWSARGEPPEGLSPEGYEALTDAHGPVNEAVRAIRGPISRDLDKHIRIIKGLGIKTAAKGVRLEPKTRRMVARTFALEGLDGNGKFPEPNDGLVKVIDVLDHFGIVLDDIVDSHRLKGNEGRISVRLGMKNPDPDPFMPPIPIANSTLVMTFYKRGEENFEVLAYLS